MNTRTYVNYFSEIKHLSKEEQISMLEEARYVASEKLKLSGKSALSFFFMVIFIASVNALVAYFSLIALVLSFPVSLFIGLFFHHRLNGKLLHQGLKVVLEK